MGAHDVPLAQSSEGKAARPCAREGWVLSQRGGHAALGDARTLPRLHSLVLRQPSPQLVMDESSVAAFNSAESCAKVGMQRCKDIGIVAKFLHGVNPCIGQSADDRRRWNTTVVCTYLFIISNVLIAI